MEKWNAQRAQAVYSALVKFLYPLMQKELYTKLLLEAKEHVLRVSDPTLTNINHPPHHVFLHLASELFRLHEYIMQFPSPFLFSSFPSNLKHGCAPCVVYIILRYVYT